MEPGTYCLTRAVANPHPDRRVNQNRLTSYEGWATWPAGLIFLAETHSEFPERIRLKARGGFFSYLDDGRADGAFRLLVAALERVKELPSDYLRRVAASPAQAALAILDRLTVNERISLAEIIVALEAIDAEEEEG